MNESTQMDNHRIDALERTVGRHETVIEMLREQLANIHSGVVRIEATLAARIGSIEALEKQVEGLKVEVDCIKSWVWKGLGGLAVLMVVVSLVGPIFLKSAASCSPQPTSQGITKTP